MAGVEQVHLTRISDDDTSPRVTQTHRQVCTAGALGPILDLDTSSRPATFRSSDRQLTLETRIPFSVFGAGAPEEIRVGFDATRGSAVHEATENADGTPAIIPVRARMRATGGAGRTIVMDGSLGEWGRITPVLFGIQDGGTQALRLMRILSFASNSDNFLYFGAVVRLASNAPFADEDLFLREPGSSVSIVAPGVLQNDGDPLGGPLTAVKTSDPENGTVTLNADGSFTYTPTIPAYDAADEFEYKATAGGRESNAARVRINVRREGAGLHPVDDSYSTPEDVTLNVPAATGVLANDPPVGSAASAVLVTAPSHGTLTLNADGGFTYKPARNFFGTDTFVYSFRVGAADFGNATVTITVSSGNDAPAVNPATFSVFENTPAGTPVGTVTFSDPDAGDNHTFSITAGNTGGAFAINPGTGLITVAGPLNFEAIPSYSLTVRVQDDGSPSKSGTATITINVTNQNDAPVAVNSAQSVPEDQLLSVPAPGLFANTSDEDGDTLTLSIVTNPANGVVTLNPDGSYTYDSNANYNGPDSFTWRAFDGTAFSNTATVNITVTPVNDPPSFTSGGNVNSPEDTPFNAPWATAISAGPADESGQTLTFNITGNSNPALFTSGPAISPAGVLTFTPALNTSGSASIDVTLSDNGGGTNTSGTVTFTITITPVDDGPVAVADAATVNEDSGANTINVLANDTDVDAGPISITSVTQPANGTVVITNAGADLTYAPNANYCNNPPGTTLDTFTYTLTPGGSSTTVTVTVTCVDDNPLAVADAATVNEDSGANAINVLANDTDVDGGSISITSVTQPANGAVVITGGGTGLTYAPNANYCNNPPGTTLDTF
ncbi:MAG TPA: Ig-like domain-containing protein, partial [Gemmatimonadaceae bacterium]|nr:Ig-like domain-containing protein [Gemmatimonadaceae bacterium]